MGDKCMFSENGKCWSCFLTDVICDGVNPLEECPYGGKVDYPHKDCTKKRI